MKHPTAAAFHAWLEDADTGRYRASTGAGGHATAIGVGVGAADKVVDGAPRVEDEVSRHALANEDPARTELKMLIAAASCERPAQLRQIGLFALALPDRIAGERDESLRRQVRRDSLGFGFPSCVCGRMGRGRPDSIQVCLACRGFRVM